MSSSNWLLPSVLCVWLALPGAALAQPAPSSGTPGGHGIRAAVSVPPTTTWAAGEAGTSVFQQADSVADGIVRGALIGAGAGLAFARVMYAGCDAGCEGPDRIVMYPLSAGIGAGVGALAGWIIDRSRRTTRERVIVAPSLTPRRQSVRVTLRF